MPIQLNHATAYLGLILIAASFGFFYAWVCSTMWGLDRISAEVAITAMQAMNGSVRNLVFAPAFFGTGPVLLLAAGLSWTAGWQTASMAFGAAGVIYIGGGMILTFAIHVPMNEALALVDPTAPDATEIWASYSPRWQFWNQVRCGFCGIALVITGFGLTRMSV